MADPQMLEIARKLLERTRNGEVNWKETVNRTEFVVSFPKQSLTVDSSYDNVYSLSLVNEKGTTVDSIRLNAEDEGYETLQALYVLTRRQALQVDARLAETFAALDQGGLIGGSR